ncbi:hypothetical protein [Mycobacteroides abscessus]|uniref:hypothetical protein n=1 Tax=Mycobacteroides abscessus TaxID=36809 RepID=UPI00092CD00C|nr:hypothetical protein [Mycobacteroides abscessus]SHS88942.1 Uncharacterised protein [Mycobacteroides abscessus subsp. abscessus]SHT05609.1 Uncharacterised protein [Mycobacteroides abscessus subsp. abscessus]
MFSTTIVNAAIEVVRAFLEGGFSYDYVYDSDVTQSFDPEDLGLIYDASVKVLEKLLKELD